jgi:hypothetical protein
MFRLLRLMRWLTLVAMIAAPLAARQDRLAWFRHDKFGMFVHWGPYSVLAGDWKGRRIPVGDNAEWIMPRFNIPVRDCREMARGFNPARFLWGTVENLARLSMRRLRAFAHRNSEPLCGPEVFIPVGGPQGHGDRRFRLPVGGVWPRLGCSAGRPVSPACRRRLVVDVCARAAGRPHACPTSPEPSGPATCHNRDAL